MKKKGNLDSIKEWPEGKYFNAFKVGYNPDVFVIDHFQILPEELPKENAEYFDLNNLFRSSIRIVTSPADAKLLSMQLKSKIEEYENEHGIINTTNNK